MQIKHTNIFKHLAIGILGCIGVGFILFLKGSHNSGILPDSVAYIAVARSLTEGAGLVTFDGFYFVLQPPLYPLLLAFIKVFLLTDPIYSAGYLNALLFGLIIYFAGLFLLKHLKSFPMVLLGTVSILVSYALIQVSYTAFSEPLFIIIVLLFLYFFEKYQSKPDYIYLFLFSVSAALACLTRYSGTIIILTGIICIFIWGKKKIKEKIWHSLIFAFISVLPVSIWIIRNYFRSGTLIGRRAASSYSLFENLTFFYNTVLSWFSPLNTAGIYFFLIFIITIILILFLLIKSKSENSEEIKYIAPALLYVVLYSFIIIISSTIAAYDQISDRLLSPIYIPIIFIFYFIIDKILILIKKPFLNKLITALIIICIILMIRYQVNSTIKVIKDNDVVSGLGYSSDSWEGSETINYIIRHKQLWKDYTFYSNEPEAVYILTNIKTKRSPAKTYYNSSQLINNHPSQLDIMLSVNNGCLVWFDKADRSFLYSIEELKIKINLTEVARLKDGKIFTFSSK